MALLSSLAHKLGLQPSGPAPTSALQHPPPKRISTAAGQRLSVITDSMSQNTSSIPPGTAITSDDVVPPLPEKSNFRRSGVWSLMPGGSAGSASSAETPPPEYANYNYKPTPPDGGYEGTEKARRLWVNHKIAKRGGWGRLVILLIVAAILAIALGVGLGVGLTQGKKKSSSSSSAGGTVSTSPSNTAAALGFPIGEYSLITALRSVQTNCTSNPSTWRCYPYSTYSGDTASSSASITTFNWILSNTSATYISNSSLPTTSSSGIAANLSISSSDNPFSISFTNQSLTYLNNDGRPRYEFQYTMTQRTVPSTALTTDKSATICFYNSTLLTGSLYISESLEVDYPTLNSTTGSYTGWPFAVRIEQVADGGADTPDCYKTVNGVVGDAVAEGFTQEASEDQCVCDYGNFELSSS